MCERGSELSDITSYNDTYPLGSEIHLVDSFNFNYFLRRPISKYSQTGVRLSEYEFWGDTHIRIFCTGLQFCTGLETGKPGVLQPMSLQRVGHD